MGSEIALARPARRLAANHASDRHAINKAESRGYSRITGSIIPATFDFYWGPPVSPYDPARAKKLLAEAGYPNGFDAGEYFCDAVLQPRRERDHLSQGGRHPGEASAPRAGGLLQGYSEKKLKNLIQGASGAFGNASARIEAFVASGGAYVYGSYDDLDGLFREQAAEMDTKRRGATLRHLQQLIHEKAMFAPIWEDRRPQRRRPASGGLGARTHRRLPILGPVRGCQAQGQVRLALRYYSWPRTGCRRVNPSQTRGELVMPVYEHFCDKCEREVQLTLSIRDHDKEPMTRYLEPNARRNRSALVSVVVPALNEERNLPHLFERLCSVFEGAGWRFELILVDDGSTDGTLAVMKEMRSRDARVRYVSLSRNFGHQAALLAGLKHAQGDVVVSMDADLQHPPETIPRMLALWLEGYDVVHTRKRSDLSAPLFRRVIAKLFYKSFNMLSDVQLVFGESDFRLQDAHVVRELCRIPEHDKFLRGLVEWLGFRQSNLDYDVPPRFAGKSTYPLGGRLRFHVNGMLSFSIIPLRLFMILGLLVAIPTGLYGVWALVAGLYGGLFGYPLWVVPGWGSIEASVTFLGGVQLLGIGILGEYLGRVFEQTKGRPEYLVRETSLSTTPHGPGEAATRDREIQL